MMKEQQPRLKFVFHDSFHFDGNTWNDLFADDDHENVVLDTHQYFAWWEKKATSVSIATTTARS